MAMCSVKCYLTSLDQDCNSLELFHGRETTFGRGPESKISENRCSREQVSMVADCEKREVKITQIGRNPAAVNGESLKSDQTVATKERDRIELLVGMYPYVIEFDPPASGRSKTDHEIRAWVPESTPGIRKDVVSDPKEEDFLGGPRCKRRRTEEPEENFYTDDGDDYGSDDYDDNNDDYDEGDYDEGDYGEDDDYDDEDGEEEEEEYDEDEGEEDLIGVWESIDNGELLVYTHPMVEPSTLVAAYDLDSTLIATKSGETFAKDKDDWKFLFPNVPEKLRQYYESNYRIVIFTNQAILSINKRYEEEFKSRIESVVREIDLPIQVFVATTYSLYRKPITGMWEEMLHRNGNLEVDLDNSFFCGDAAGRGPEGNRKKKDFSESDLAFAKNLSLPFETPEHHFLNMEMPPLNTTVFDPFDLPTDMPLCTPSWGQIISNRLEVIILVGCPGSGKSHFSKTHLTTAGYVHVNSDTFGKWTRCVRVMEAALRSKRRAVVDNTNPDVESRKRYISAAKKYTPFIRCFIMNTTPGHAKHNNKFRQLIDPNQGAVTDTVMNNYLSKYEEPTHEEGFTEILRINFWPTFKDEEDEKLYKLILLEK